MLIIVFSQQRRSHHRHKGMLLLLKHKLNRRFAFFMVIEMPKQYAFMGFRIGQLDRTVGESTFTKVYIYDVDLRQFIDELPNEYTTISPSGFEWGYTGSGPSALAYQLIKTFFRYEELEVDDYLQALIVRFFIHVIAKFPTAWVLNNYDIAHFIINIAEKDLISIPQKILEELKRRYPIPAEGTAFLNGLKM